ncbi:MAG: hypothetical protein Unbinned7794contig1000_43 [Prokaryotic dsDNA virus sp.]|nr:MAG: hypothetical protein Unbinned7794contig1000_43 [Prokaryotic dsDNA virus sp.]|tara:strand:+ start:14922 stop:15296 length:375 start_codon:yes stop_codon:yes gene_type:complete
MKKPLYEDPETMQVMIDLYFDDCVAREAPPTMAGLAYGLGFQSRDALNDYQRKADGSVNEQVYKSLAGTIKKAKLRVELATVERAMKSNGAGPIFMLKNMGYTDKQVVELEAVTINIIGKDTLL